MALLGSFPINLSILEMVAMAAHELLLFSLVGFLIGGADDLLIDVIWICRAVWRRVTIYRRRTGSTSATLDAAREPGCAVVFLPAWDEGAVIGPMLAHAVSAFRGQDYRIYVGCYPNDAATVAAIMSVGADRVRVVIGTVNGPTTKADCLNTLWRALIADELAGDWRAKSIVLHDAEDVVHSAELRVFDRLIERFDFVQLPVMPLIDAGSRWIGGHYIDEFAEAHGKTIVVREAIGAGIPAAGVGCAFARDMMGRIAEARGGNPFDQDSLTEDYELGLRIAELGGRGIFVRLPHAGGGMVAVRAHFPATLDEAVRQKSRWIAGIALSGWDRLGWRGGLAESWMRLHDRRALAGATILLAAYAGLLLAMLLRVWLDRWPAGAANIAAVARSAAGERTVAVLAAGTAVRLRLGNLRMARRGAFGSPRNCQQCHRDHGGAARGGNLPAHASRRRRPVGQDRPRLPGDRPRRMTARPMTRARLPMSRPLRAFVAVVGGWIALRVIVLWHAAAGSPGVAYEVRAELPVPNAVLATAIVVAAGAWTASHTDRVHRRVDTPRQARDKIVGSSSQSEFIAAEILPNTADRNSPPIAPWLPPSSPTSSRFSGSAWALFRPDSSGATLGSGGTLGGSQAGVRIFYEPGPKGLALTARISAPLAMSKGREASAGVGFRRSNAGILLERRIALDSGGRNAVSLTAYGGISDVTLSYGFRLDGYAQAGVVGIHRRDGFADGAVSIVHPVIRSGAITLSAGGVVSGGVQPGVGRGDIGPELVATMPVEGRFVRIAAGWRERVVGNAAPGSGPSLSIGIGF